MTLCAELGDVVTVVDCVVVDDVEVDDVKVVILVLHDVVEEVSTLLIELVAVAVVLVQPIVVVVTRLGDMTGVLIDDAEVDIQVVLDVNVDVVDKVKVVTPQLGSCCRI